MSKKAIIWIAVVLVIVSAAVGVGYYYYLQSRIVKVATGKAVRQDLLSVVSGTGQIKPKTYVNVGATSFGRITHLYVKEGDHVRKGDIVARVESVQPESAVDAQHQTITLNQRLVDANIANEKLSEASVEQAKANLEQGHFDYERAKALYAAQIMAKQDFDAKKAAYDVDVATLAQREAALVQARAQTESSRSQVSQSVATLRGNDYNLDLTISRAPFDGLVTNVPVREGETVVVGIQNAEGSTLMTLADMSVITAEVKVDETDIVNMALGQTADVTVDALPGRIFKGHVTEVGDQALLRTTGIATSQSTTGTEEAKDFKVVVTLDPVPGTELDDLRPGLSTTARITVAHKANALTIPIQALVQRDPAAEKVLWSRQGKPVEIVASAAPSNGPAPKPALVQGVYVLIDDKGTLRPSFIPVSTGVTGASDIEVIGGLKEGDELVIGRYKVLRALKSGIEVKRDNSTDASPDDKT
jgi:HlyD family secretion protein